MTDLADGSLIYTSGSWYYITIDEVGNRTINALPSGLRSDIEEYLSKLTSEHNQKPKFVASVSALVQPFSDDAYLTSSLPYSYDLDSAVGSQLDVIGLWAGQSRQLTIPLTGVYFSWDTEGVGWDEGYWIGPFDPVTGMASLGDEPYRTLLRARIAANVWDGTIPQAYNVWNALFSSIGYGIIIQDNGDMTIELALTGPTTDAVTRALFTIGLLALKPSGVRIASWLLPVANVPYFGFDVDNDAISGFDVGAWGIRNSD